MLLSEGTRGSIELVISVEAMRGVVRPFNLPVYVWAFIQPENDKLENK